MNSPIRRYIDIQIKRQSQQYAAYKRFISTLRKHIDSKLRYGKRYSMQMESQKKKGVAIVILDKISFRSKMVTGDKMFII